MLPSQARQPGCATLSAVALGVVLVLSTPAVLDAILMHKYRIFGTSEEIQRDLQRPSSDFVISHSNFQREYYSKVQRTRVIHQVANTLARSSSFPLKIAVENHKITAGRMQIALQSVHIATEPRETSLRLPKTIADHKNHSRAILTPL